LIDSVITKFKKFSGLCDHNLSPILDNQVEEAIRSADGGDVGIKNAYTNHRLFQ
jgi:hypothetical protein